MGIVNIHRKINIDDENEKNSKINGSYKSYIFIFHKVNNSMKRLK